MRLTEFRDLCQQQWKQCHGEIFTLWLTEESYRELQKDAVGAGAHDERVLTRNEEYADLELFPLTGKSSGRSPAVGMIRNPVTKNPVRMKLARDRDVADIFDGDNRVIVTKLI